jgi:hypothetical protein
MKAPDDVHLVDRNASGTRPAKFPVLLIKDKGAPGARARTVIVTQPKVRPWVRRSPGDKHELGQHLTPR